MKGYTKAVVTVTGILLAIPQAYAGLGPPDPGVVVPEMDGSGAVIAIGLVVGLVALFREKFFRK